MGIYRIDDQSPRIDDSAYVADNATVIGNVVIGRGCSVWSNSVLRGDNDTIRVGARTNIQDSTIVHITQHEGEERSGEDGYPTIIGSEVTVGHRVILHGCTVGDLCLIGMGAILLDGVVIGNESIVGAGSVVTPGKHFPARSLIMGTPAKVVKEVTEAQVLEMQASWKRYVALKNEYHRARVGDCF